MFTLILFSLNSVLKMFQMWYAPFYYTCYCHKGNLSFVFHRIQTVVYQAAPTRLLLPWEFPGKNTGVGCHFLLQRNLPDPGIKPRSPALQADALTSELPGKPIIYQKLLHILKVRLLRLKVRAFKIIWDGSTRRDSFFCLGTSNGSWLTPYMPSLV